MGLILTIILSLVAAAILIPILKVASGKKSVQELSKKWNAKRDRRTARRETRTKMETASQYFDDNPSMTRKDKVAYLRDSGILQFGRD